MSKQVQFRWRGNSSEGGSAMVELALLAPVLVFLMTGTFDFGRALYEQYRLTAAANTGAQYAVYQLSPNVNGSWQTLSASSGSGSIASIVQQNANNSSLTVAPVECNCPSSTGVCSTAAGGKNVCTVGESGSGTTTTEPTGYNPTFVVVQATETYYTMIPYPFIGQPITLTGQAVAQVN